MDDVAFVWMMLVVFLHDDGWLVNSKCMVCMCKRKLYIGYGELLYALYKVYNHFKYTNNNYVVCYLGSTSCKFKMCAHVHACMRACIHVGMGVCICNCTCVYCLGKTFKKIL